LQIYLVLVYVIILRKTCQAKLSGFKKKPKKFFASYFFWRLRAKNSAFLFVYNCMAFVFAYN